MNQVLRYINRFDVESELPLETVSEIIRPRIDSATFTLRGITYQAPLQMVWLEATRYIICTDGTVIYATEVIGVETVDLTWRDVTE